MTQRERLNNMSNKDLAEFLCSEELQRLKMAATSSVWYLEKWLSMEIVQEPKEFVIKDGKVEIKV